MTLLDQMMAVVTPHRTEEERSRVRLAACALSLDGGWLSEVVRQHAAIEEALLAVSAGADPVARRHALQWLSTLLTGHSLAEQAVLYPALSFDRQRAQAVSAYADESNLKVELAAMQAMDPMSLDFSDKLERLRADLAFHLYEEEGSWYPALYRGIDGARHAELSERFVTEFQRYMGADGERI